MTDLTFAPASLAWTAAAVTVASLSDEWPGRLLVAGPIAMAVGLLGLGLLMAPGPVAAPLLPIFLIGIGKLRAEIWLDSSTIIRGQRGGHDNLSFARDHVDGSIRRARPTHCSLRCISLRARCFDRLQGSAAVSVAAAVASMTNATGS